MNLKIQFSIFALLLIIALVAGYLAGLDRGFDVGQQQWMDLPKIVKTCNLEAVLTPRMHNRINNGIRTTHPNGIGAEVLEEFVEELKSNVRPVVWKNDSSTTLTIFIPKLAIIVMEMSHFTMIFGNTLTKRSNRMPALRYWPFPSTIDGS